MWWRSLVLVLVSGGSFSFGSERPDPNCEAALLRQAELVEKALFRQSPPTDPTILIATNPNRFELPDYKKSDFRHPEETVISDLLHVGKKAEIPVQTHGNYAAKCWKDLEKGQYRVKLFWRNTELFYWKDHNSEIFPWVGFVGSQLSKEPMLYIGVAPALITLVQGEATLASDILPMFVRVNASQLNDRAMPTYITKSISSQFTPRIYLPE